MFRFAPSPTGDMHIGNLRAALINFICSRQSKRHFYLRIEDSDQARNIPGKEQEIKDILQAFRLNPDAIFIQSQSLALHQELAHALVERHLAFICYCTDEELAQKKELAKQRGEAYRYDGSWAANGGAAAVAAAKKSQKPYAIRLNEPKTAITFIDEIKGSLSFEPKDIDSFVILRANGMPTYNFACCVDDMQEGVSFIIRGEDHVSNTPRQEHLRTSLNELKRPDLAPQSPRYAHLPIVLNELGAKMSKREAHSSISYLLELGIIPEAISNYLLLLGNKPPKEFFTLEEAVEFFDIKKLSKSPARFDFKLLLHLNNAHLKALDDDELSSLLKNPHQLASSDLAALARLYLQEANTTVELDLKLSNIFTATDFGGFDAKPLIRAIKELQSLQALPQDFELFKELLIEKSGLKGKNLFMPLRFFLSSLEKGPELKDLYPLLRPYIGLLLQIKGDA